MPSALLSRQVALKFQDLFLQKQEKPINLLLASLLLLPHPHHNQQNPKILVRNNSFRSKSRYLPSSSNGAMGTFEKTKAVFQLE